MSDVSQISNRLNNLVGSGWNNNTSNEPTAKLGIAG